MVIVGRQMLNFPGFIQKVMARTVGAHVSCKFCTASKRSRQAHHTMMYLTCIFPLCSRLLCAPSGKRMNKC